MIAQPNLWHLIYDLDCFKEVETNYIEIPPHILVSGFVFLSHTPQRFIAGHLPFPNLVTSKCVMFRKTGNGIEDIVIKCRGTISNPPAGNCVRSHFPVIFTEQCLFYNILVPLPIIIYVKIVFFLFDAFKCCHWEDKSSFRVDDSSWLVRPLNWNCLGCFCRNIKW